MEQGHQHGVEVERKVHNGKAAGQEGTGQNLKVSVKEHHHELLSCSQKGAALWEQ